MGEAANEVDAALNRGKIASAEASRLAEELRHEQERSNQIDRVRKALEFQVKVGTFSNQICEIIPILTLNEHYF